jgi:hypothetical protein
MSSETNDLFRVVAKRNAFMKVNEEQVSLIGHSRQRQIGYDAGVALEYDTRERSRGLKLLSYQCMRP